MNTNVAKWGNSLAVRIPQPLAEKLGISEGSVVELTESSGSLIISKPMFQIKELLATYDSREPELDWGPAQGNEIW